MKNEQQGFWRFARAYGDALSETLGENLAGAFVVGSLAQNEPLNDQSEIEVVCVMSETDLKDCAEVALGETTARFDEPRPTVRLIRLLESDLNPPYAPEREITPEVLRLQDEGVCIGGRDLRADISRPGRDDLMSYIHHFDKLIRHTALRADATETPGYPHLHHLAATACRNYVFSRDRLLIWRHSDALMAFWMGYAEHRAAPFVKRLIRQGPSIDPDDERVAPAVAQLWRVLHREILA